MFNIFVFIDSQQWCLDQQYFMIRIRILFSMNVNDGTLLYIIIQLMWDYLFYKNVLNQYLKSIENFTIRHALTTFNKSIKLSTKLEPWVMYKYSKRSLTYPGNDILLYKYMDKVYFFHHIKTEWMSTCTKCSRE